METNKMASQSEASTYSTKDLYEASFLYATGKELLDLARDGSQAWFIFEDQHSCEELVKQYWARKGSVTPKIFAEAIRSLKDKLFANK